MSIELDDLVSILELESLVPCFQPQVDIGSGTVVGFEVLTRCNHPVQGLVLPANLISLAEQHGLIDAVMNQVFPQAFRAIQTLDRPMRLAVNLSPIQFTDRTLPQRVAHMAAEAGLPMSSLMVEITESALLSDLVCASDIAREFKQLGAQLSLDDFGTGYSSLGHLQALAFNELKIDRSFIDSMLSRRESRKIVGAVIGLGNSLGIHIVGEGVETEEQAEMLFQLDCEIGQGWLYGHPIPASGLASALAKPRHAARHALLARPERSTISTLECLPNLRLPQLKALYKGAPVGFCLLDRNMRYLNLNDRLAAMNEMPLAAHLGRTAKEILPALYYKTIEPYLLRALAGKASTKVEVVWRSSIQSGLDRSHLLSCQPVWDESDEIVGISVAIFDLTDHATYRPNRAKRFSRNSVPLDLFNRSLESLPRWLHLPRPIPAIDPKQ